jgi:hypothetical protein
MSFVMGGGVVANHWKANLFVYQFLHLFALTIKYGGILPGYLNEVRS